jgi:hypothetical protein
MKKILLITIAILVVLAVHSKGAFTQQVKPEASKLLNDAIGLLSTEEEGMPSVANVDSAIDKLKNAVKLEPSYYEAYVKLGIAYGAKRVLLGSNADTIKDAKIYKEKSREVLQKAINMAPNRPEAYHEYLHVSDKNERGKIVSRLYELEPNDPDVMYFKGYDLIEKGNIAEGTSLVLKGMRGGDEGEVWAKKEKLAHVLKRRGHDKEADEITRSVNNDKKYHEGEMQLMYHDVDTGLRLIRESAGGDLKQLSASQKAAVAKELENRERFKDAAQMFELIDPIKHQDHIKDLKNKAASQKKSKPEER